MNLKQQVYSVLIVSAAEKMNTALCGLMPEAHFNPIRIVSGISDAKRIWNERSYDFVLINAPLSDNSGIQFAVDIINTNRCVVLLLVQADLHDEINERVVPHGIFTLAKPLSLSTLSIALSWMASARERLRKLEKKTLSIEEKMAEIRVVNRAKWQLISELKMDEPQAHRYIEKQAMDRCVSRQVIAEEILRMYSV